MTRGGIYKSFISADDFRKALSSRVGEWVSLTELTSMLWDKIPPEAAVRIYHLQNPNASCGALGRPLSEQIAIGKRLMVSKRSGAMRKHGVLETQTKKATGREQCFRITNEDSKQNSQDRPDPPRRRHATKNGDR